jgi:hypothetical protein
LSPGDEKRQEKKTMSLKYLAIAAALAVAPAAFAQQPGDAQMQPGAAGQSGETSDRTPDKATPTPLNQKDTADGKTSDRSQDKNVKVEHQPGAAGTAGSTASEGASSGTSGNDTKIPAADPPAAAGSK